MITFLVVAAIVVVVVVTFFTLLPLCKIKVDK